MEKDNFIKYPDIRVKLIGEDGNAFYIIAVVRKALMQHKVPENEIEEFTRQAMSGDYDNLLRVVLSTVEVD